MRARDAILTPDQERTYRLLVLNGALIACAYAFITPSIVLPAFVFKLTASTTLVGLVSSIQGAGWLWPQMVISNLVEHRQRKMPFYLWPGVGRILTWGLIVAAVLLTPAERPLLLFWAFVALLGINASCSGIGGVPFMDIVSKTIPRERRIRLFSDRRVFGGILAILAGVAVWYVLSDTSGIAFPYNYAVLFGSTMVLCALAIGTFLMIREPVEPVNKERKPFGDHLKNGPKLLKRDKEYRGLLFCRIFWSVGMMFIPFMVPYAVESFGISQAMTGPYVSAAAISGLLATRACRRIGERYGHKVMLLWSLAVLALAPPVAIAVKLVPAAKLSPVFGASVGLDLQSLALFLPFLIYAWGASGIIIGNMTYLMAIAPSRIRPTYFGFMNTFVFPLNLVPLLAGKMLSYVSYEVMFGLSFLASLIALGSLRLLSEPTQEEVERRGDILLEDEDGVK